jgi:adenosylmethionine-8-amino-7-oxononanoate aminotransferase
MPPYCIDDDALDLLAAATRDAIHEATQDADACA